MLIINNQFYSGHNTFITRKPDLFPIHFIIAT